MGGGGGGGVQESGSLLPCRVLKAEFSKQSSQKLTVLVGEFEGQFCRCDCSVLAVSGVSLVLSVQSFRKLIMQVGEILCHSV